MTHINVAADEVTIRHGSGAYVVVSAYSLEPTSSPFEVALAYDIEVRDVEHATPELESHQRPVEPGGQKYDEGKLDWTLLPPEAIEDVVRVLQYGAVKYGRDNWRYLPDGKRRCRCVAARYLRAISLGEDIDIESGLPHIAHAVCSLLFIGYFG